MRNILNNLEDAAAKLQDMGKKAVEDVKDTFDQVGDDIDKAVADAKTALGRAIDSLTPDEPAPTEPAPEKPRTLDDELEQDVTAQLNTIRSAQQTPGAFSDYIANKFGKDK